MRCCGNGPLKMTAIALSTALATSVVLLSAANADDGPTHGEAQAAQRGGGGPFGDIDLIGAMMEVEGCLGVEAAQTMSGKQVLFAWFEDKDALLRWYYHPTHQGAMRAFFPDREDRKPMADIPNDGRPIMAVASITMAPEGTLDGTELPLSQIAIELYSPLNGGIFIGGRFAPEEMEVESMLDVMEH